MQQRQLWWLQIAQGLRCWWATAQNSQIGGSMLVSQWIPKLLLRCLFPRRGLLKNLYPRCAIGYRIWLERHHCLALRFDRIPVFGMPMSEICRGYRRKGITKLPANWSSSCWCSCQQSSGVCFSKVREDLWAVRLEHSPNLKAWLSKSWLQRDGDFRSKKRKVSCSYWYGFVIAPTHSVRVVTDASRKNDALNTSQTDPTTGEELERNGSGYAFTHQCIWISITVGAWSVC